MTGDPRATGASLTAPPLVDIVLATHRSSPFLAETLASVSQQVHVAWHLTVVDDGSPDPAFLAALLPAGPSVTLIRQAPGGVSRARNVGLRRCTGELVSFLDDDDLWEPDRLSTLVAALADNPRAVGAYSGATYIDEQGATRGEGWPGTPGSSKAILSGSVALPRLPTLLFNRRVIQASGGFNEAYRVAEDNDLILRVLQRGELIGVNRPLVRYRRHPGNTSTAGTLEARLISRQMLLQQATVAWADGRSPHALALEANLRRVEPDWAAESLRGLKSAVGNRRWAQAACELLWSLRAHPRQSWLRLALLVSKGRRLS